MNGTGMGEAMMALAAVGGVFALFWWVVAACIIATIASERGRSGLAYFLICIFLTPLFAALVLIAAPNRAWAESERSVRRREAEELKDAIQSLLKQLDATRQNTASRDMPVNGTKPVESDGLMIASSKPPPAGLGYCPQCKKLRGLTVNRCINCGNTDPVPMP